MKNTLVINLFGGPGIGKSTTAALVFVKLKLAGVDSEYVPEFAKDCVWEKRHDTFNDQIYIFGKQQHRIARLAGKVDVVVTDSPILLNVYYGKDNKPLVDLTLSEFAKYNNLNYRLIREKEYNPNGRNQTEAEAKAIDEYIKDVLDTYNISYKTLPGNVCAADNIINDILEFLGRTNND